MVETTERREIIFTEKLLRSGEEPTRGVRFTVDETNRVSWQEFPAGEQGEGLPYPMPRGVDMFMEQIARVLGYPRRLVLSEGLDFRANDADLLHKNGRMPTEARIFKADIF